MPNYTDLLAHEDPEFAAAVEAVLEGDCDALTSLLAKNPGLVDARSRSPHHATLLHYVAANGIEDELQVSPGNAAEIARILTGAGALADEICDTYGGGPAQTTLALTVSSSHPAARGVQADIVRALCAAGAEPDGRNRDGTPLATALAFGYPAAVAALVGCGAKTGNIVFAAAAGRLNTLRAFAAPNGWRAGAGGFETRWFRVSNDVNIAAEQGMVAAAMCGQIDAIRFLTEQGVSVNCAPEFSHMAATPLHTAALQGNLETCAFLIDLGADRANRDRTHNNTPAGWAMAAGHPDLAAMLNG